MGASPLRNIIVVGGGGNLGSYIVNALNHDPNFQVSVLSRSSSKSTFPADVKVRKIADDYPEYDLLQAFSGQDAVVSTIGAAHALQQIPMIDAAIRVGVRHFLPAEFGGNKENPKTATYPLFANKQKVLTHLKSKESDDFGWTGIATGPFLDWGLKNGFLGFDLHSHKALIYDSGKVTWSATILSTIGLAVAKVLREPLTALNKFVFVSSITTSQGEILSTLQEVTGEKWDVQYTTAEAAVKGGQDKLSKGDMSGVVPLLLSTIFQDGFGAEFRNSVPAANHLLDLPEESLEDLVRSFAN